MESLEPSLRGVALFANAIFQVVKQRVEAEVFDIGVCEQIVIRVKEHRRVRAFFPADIEVMPQRVHQFFVGSHSSGPVPRGIEESGALDGPINHARHRSLEPTAWSKHARRPSLVGCDPCLANYGRVTVPRIESHARYP